MPEEPFGRVPPSVLVLSHASELGGASRSALTVVEQLRAANWPVVVLAPDGPLRPILAQRGAQVVLWDPPVSLWPGFPLISSGLPPRSLNVLGHDALALARLPFRVARAAEAIRTLVAQRGVNTIYVNSLALFPLSGVLAALRRQAGVRVLWQVREVLNPRLPGWLYRRIARNLAQAADRVIAITSNEAQAFADLAPTVVIHNAVPDDWQVDIRPPEAPREGPLQVCMAAAFNSGKGLADFLAMAAIAHQHFPEAEFVLYVTHPRLRHGPTARILAAAGLWNDRVPLVIEALEQATELKLRAGVRIVFDHAMTLDTYRQATVYVRPDRAACPWGRDIIEAMWAGVPVVATGACQEFVIDGETGYLVPPARPEQLAEKVCQLLGDERLRAAMAQAARVRAQALFSPELFREKISQVFGLAAERERLPAARSDPR